MNILADNPNDGLRHPLEPHTVWAWLPRRAPDWGPVQHAVACAVAQGRRVKAPSWPVPPPSPGVAAALEAASAVSPITAGGRAPPWSTPIYDPSSTESQLARRYRLAPEAVARVADKHTRALYGAGMHRSVEQQRAIYAVLAARDAVTQLVVRPTAGGKTATFIVPAVAEAAAAVTASRRLQAIGTVAPLAGTGLPTPWYPPVTTVLTPARAITANIVGAARGQG